MMCLSVDSSLCQCEQGWAEEKAAYRLDRPTGRFLPANQAALDECATWNTWAVATMRRFGTLPAAPTAPRPPFVGEHRVDW